MPRGTRSVAPDRLVASNCRPRVRAGTRLANACVRPPLGSTAGSRRSAPDLLLFEGASSIFTAHLSEPSLVPSFERPARGSACRGFNHKKRVSHRLVLSTVNAGSAIVMLTTCALPPPSVGPAPVLALLQGLPGVQQVSDDVRTFIDPICPTTAPPPAPESYRWGPQKMEVSAVDPQWPQMQGSAAVTVSVLNSGASEDGGGDNCEECEWEGP
jgi:hypothetical protein